MFKVIRNVFFLGTVFYFKRRTWRFDFTKVFNEAFKTLMNYEKNTLEHLTKRKC